jgi:hypothetical protein
MLDLKTNALEWRAVMETQKAKTMIVGNWDQPPDYPNLTTAIRKSVKRARDFLVRDFFEQPDEAGNPPREPPIRPGCSDDPEYRKAPASEKRRMLEDCRR